jgi:UTP-glucose-1-phosphate uridylyltransferase
MCVCSLVNQKTELFSHAPTHTQYAVDHKLFQLLDEDVRHDLRGANGEIQLTPALDRLRLAQGLAGVVVDGERLSISTPDAYIRANQRLLDLSLDSSRSSSSKPTAPVHKRRTSSTS